MKAKKKRGYRSLRKNNQKKWSTILQLKEYSLLRIPELKVFPYIVRKELSLNGSAQAHSEIRLGALSSKTALEIPEKDDI